MKSFPPFLLAVVLIPLFSTVQGEVLLLDAINNTPMNGSEGIARPGRGQTMNRVRELFGEPVTVHPGWVIHPSPVGPTIILPFTSRISRSSTA